MAAVAADEAAHNMCGMKCCMYTCTIKSLPYLQTLHPAGEF